MNKVLCDYNVKLLSQKEDKRINDNTPPNVMGYMCAFKYLGTPKWMDATEEMPGPGRLINHSQCCANVSINNNYNKPIDVALSFSYHYTVLR